MTLPSIRRRFPLDALGVAAGALLNQAYPAGAGPFGRRRVEAAVIRTPPGDRPLKAPGDIDCIAVAKDSE